MALMGHHTSLPTAVTPSHDRRGRLDQNKISRAICAILLFELASSDQFHSTSSDYDFRLRLQRKCEIKTSRCHKLLTTSVKKVSLDLSFFVNNS